ncbi:TPA: hypothetical protein ACH3X1_012455 [Trebouxia sp. C0004]
MLLPRSTLRVMAANMTPPQMQPVAATIHKKLTEALKPSNLKVTNESHKHAGHSGNPSGAPDAETHFEYASFADTYKKFFNILNLVQVVSDAFAGKRLVQRHKMVYSILDHELKTGVHALALKTKTPDEMTK